MSFPNRLVRPSVRKLRAYVPGEQPRIKGLIKLNTNENPYPPSPRVLRAIKAAADGRLRLYPNPTAQPLRDALARFHQCGAENIIIGNGSDDLLALATRAFVEPAGTVHPQSAPRHRELSRASIDSKCVVQCFDPSYSLYAVLASIHGARLNAVPLREDFDLPDMITRRRVPGWDSRAALTFVTTPNAPSGRGYSRRQLETICRRQSGVVVLDEAYVDFADEDAMDLALQFPNVLVSRTFSKAYSLCFLRVGYFVGNPVLIQALDKIRDSYNVNGLGQVAALATLEDPGYYRKNFRTIIAARDRLLKELENLEFAVCPSQTNFLLARPPVGTAERWLERLRERRILVRWFDTPKMRDYLRVTIGSESEIDSLIRAVTGIRKTWK